MCLLRLISTLSRISISFDNHFVNIHIVEIQLEKQMKLISGISIKSRLLTYIHVVEHRQNAKKDKVQGVSVSDDRVVNIAVLMHLSRVS